MLKQKLQLSRSQKMQIGFAGFLFAIIFFLATPVSASVTSEWNNVVGGTTYDETKQFKFHVEYNNSEILGNCYVGLYQSSDTGGTYGVYYRIIQATTTGQFTFDYLPTEFGQAGLPYDGMNITVRAYTYNLFCDTNEFGTAIPLYWVVSSSTSVVPVSTSTASTTVVDNPSSNVFYGFIVFFIAMLIPMWYFRKRI